MTQLFFGKMKNLNYKWVNIEFTVKLAMPRAIIIRNGGCKKKQRVTDATQDSPYM